MTKITITKQVKEGESVSIQATPATKDYDFDSYSGNINGTTTGGRTQENGNNPLSFNATTNSNIVANFKGTNEGRIEIRWYNSVNEPGYGPITRTSASLNATNLRGVQRISDYGNAINVNGTLNSGRWTGYYEGIITGFPISAIRYVGFREEGGTYPGSSRSNVYYADFSACTGMTVFGNSSNNQQFYYHNTIETVKLPSSIESIYFTAFAGSNIKTLYIYATTPPSISGSQYSSGDIIFSGCSNLRRIYVPAGSVNAYKSATAWSYYSDKITAIIDVSSEVNPANSGTVSKAASETSELSNTQSSALDGLILTASGNSGYSFSSWNRGATVLSTSNPYTLYSPDNINGTDTIIAEFLPIYSINTSINPSGGGTVSGTGSYSYGDTVSLTATAASGYEFSEWTENGTTVSSNSTYSFTATQDRTLVAVFTVSMTEITITTTGADTVYLKNSSDSVYTWNLTSGTNTYDGSESGFELNNLKSIYKYTAASGVSTTNTITGIDISSSSITSLDQYAFYRCAGLTSITLPNSLTTIGNGALRNTGLTSITLPNSLTRIADSAFQSCTSLTSITLPDSLTTIGQYAFQSCTSLASITLPDSLTSILYSAFNGCTSLTSITFPNSLTTIGSEAFWGCTNLSSITLTDNITSIYRNSFSGTAWWSNQEDTIVYSSNICFGYKTTKPTGAITITSNTKTIAGSAFYNCTGLTSITCMAITPPSIINNSFNNTSNCPIYVPSDSVNDYKSSWSTYSSRIQAIPS